MSTPEIEASEGLNLDFGSASRFLGLVLDEDEWLGRAGSEFPQIRGYIVNSVLGEGGSGRVYRAVAEGSSRAVAIKVLKHPFGEREANPRAWRELDVLADLRLDDIPAIHDYGIYEGRMYIVTAHVEGLSLDDYCREKNLDRRQRVELLIRVAEAVQRLHEHGIIHRDIKPSNIIITEGGRPVIIDFGIAMIPNNKTSAAITQEGVPIGTLAYMSPEQARGERENISVRTDVFSLGAMACDVLTGQPPHDLGDVLHEAVRRAAQDPPRDPMQLDSSLPEPLAWVLARAVAQQTADRYPSAAAFAEDLRRWLRDEPIDWQRPSWLKRQRLAMRRNPRGYFTRAGVALLLLILFVISIVAMAQWQVERNNAETELQLRVKTEDVLEKEIELKREATRLLEQEQCLLEEERQSKADLEKKMLALAALYQDAQQWIRDQRATLFRIRDDGYKSLANDQLYDAVFALHAIAEIYRGGRLSDQEVMNTFNELMRAAFDKVENVSPPRTPRKE